MLPPGESVLRIDVPNSSPMPFVLLVLDLDGTLVDTRDDITENFLAVVEGASLPSPSLNEIHPLIGLPLATMFRRILPDGTTDLQIDQLVVAYRARYRQLVVARTRPFPGVPETLARCQQGNLRLAVATSKMDEVAHQAIAAAGLVGFFDLVLGDDSVQRPKPAPDLVLRILDALDVEASRTLVVGDTIYDLAMGQAAGTATCAVTYGVQNPADLRAARPDFVIDRFEDLLEIVGLDRGK